MTTMFRQDARLGRLATVLGEDVLVLVQFAGAEAMSTLFDFQVDCMSVDPDVDFDVLIGTHATVSVTLRNSSLRHFDGIVTEARWLGPEGPGHQYRLTLNPWFHLATLRRNQRIFHEKTVVQIVTEVLGQYADAGTLKTALIQTYPKLEYTVQYRESDFAFVSRMLERFGISYHFQHRAGAHDMVLTDAPDAHARIGARPYKPAADRHQQDIEHFHSWHPTRRMTTGAIRLTDYNFKTPPAKMESAQTGDAAYAQGAIESFDYPGEYLSPSRGKVVAQLRTRQERAQDRRFVASGDIPDLAAGAVVTLVGEPVPGTGADYLCLSAQHRYAANAYGSGDLTGDAVAYHGRYVLAPVTAPILPERKTKPALVQGPQTARVVGEGEIDCDEYGRILVRFHWDLHDAFSMRCRVSQNWSGNGWGGMIIPRIGMEVVVEFLEGDPDKPLVTGCVYNGKNKVPYDLPGNKTKSTFRTDTHKGNGFSELTFEDEAGREEILLRSSRDLTVKVDNHATARITHNDIRSIGGFQLVEVEQSQSVNIGANFAMSVGAGPGGSQIDGPERDDTFGLRPAAYAIQAMAGQSGSGSYSVITTGLMRFEAGGAHALDVTTIAHERVGSSKMVNVGEDYMLSVTGDSKETAGKRKVIDAHEEIMLRCGKSVLRMKADGSISLNGKRLDIEQADAMVVKAGRIDLN